MSYSKSQCLEALSEIASLTDGKLSVRAYREHMNQRHPSVRTIQNKFQTWNNAKDKVDLGTTPATQPVNTDYFDNLNAESSYWIGFIIADAYVDEKQFKLKITKRDKEHLEQFKNDIEAGHVIHDDDSGEGGTSVSITIGRHDFTKPLFSIIGENKTFTDSIPEIPDEYLNHFIRGVFDGDGTMRKNKKEIVIAGHTPRMKVLSDIVPCNTEAKENTEHPTEKHGYLYCSGQEAIKMAEWMYPDGEETEPKLDRKYPTWL